MKKLKIGKSDIHGKGLFTGEPIRKGDLIAKVHSGIQLDPETVKYMPTQYGRFYNHDEKKFNTTNEIIGNHRYLRAVKNIPANTELTANYREHSEMEQPENFGSGKYASFDFDKTIATDEGLAKARQMLKDGYNLFIVSARDKVTPDMVARARKAGIPEENIIATGSDEAKVRKVKQLGVEKHFDDKPEVIAALGLVGEQFKKGGGLNSKKYTRSITGTNKLFTKNNLFKKKSTKRIYDPNAKYYAEGGESGCPDGFEEDPQTGECIPIREKVEDIQEMPRPIVQKPPWYQESFVNPAAYVSGYRGGDPRMYKYGFLDSDQGQIIGGGGFGFPKPGVHLSALGVVPTSSNDRQYFKGAYEAGISKDIKNLNLGLGVGTAITGYPGENGFVRDPIKLQPKLNLKYNFAEGGASGCPKGFYWNGKKCVKLLTRVYNNIEQFDKANQLMQDSTQLFNLNAIGKTNLNNRLNDWRSNPFVHEKDIWGNETGRNINTLRSYTRRNISSNGILTSPKWNDYTPFAAKYINPNIKPIQRVTDKIYGNTRTILNRSYTPPWEKPHLEQNYYDVYRAPNTQPVYQEKPSVIKKFYPKIKDPVKDPIKDPIKNSVLPTTRTVYIDCPPGSVANDQTTKVTTDDPDSPGNYLTTITTGCDPIKEKEVIVPIKEPVINTEEVPMGTQEYPEELEGPNWEWDRKYHSFTTPRLNKHFPLGPLFNGKKKHTFSTPSLHRRKDYEDGGIIADFSRDQIQEYINGGYIVEELDDYAKGGEPCPDGMIFNEVTKDCITADEHQKFLVDWYENRKMPDPLDQENFQKVQPEILSRVNNFPPYVLSEDLDEGTAGYYDDEEKIIALNKFLPEVMQEGTKTHENNHYLTSGAKTIKNFAGPHGYIVEQNIRKPKEINTGNPEWDKNLKNNYEDIVLPDEIQSRLMTFRKLAGFKPDQVITEKDVEDYFKNAGGKLDPDIQDIKQVTKDTKAVVNLLNGIVSTPVKSKDLQYAQIGGGLHKFAEGGEPCPQGFQEDPVTGDCVVITERTQDIQEVSTNQYSPYIAAYEEAHPRDEFVYHKKADYLKRNKSLNRMSGLSQDNFNTDVEGNFNRNWEYDRNSAVIEQFAKDHGINPKNHVEIVEKMADKGKTSYDMIAHSKYGSKLQPSMWARSLAGAQELGNAIVKPYIGAFKGNNYSRDVFNKEIKGLTKKENKEIHDSPFGALESLAWMDHPGLIIGNALSGASLASGSGYGDKDKPGFFSGEFTSEMDPLKAAVLNPALYADLGLGMLGPARAGLRAAPLLTKVDDVMDIVNFGRKANSEGLFKGAKGIGKFLDTESGLLSNASKINPWAGTFQGESLLPKGLQFNKLDDPEAFYRLTKDPKNYGLGVDSYFNKGVPLTGDLANTFPKGSRAWGHRYSGPKYNQQTGKIDEYFGKDHLFKVEDESLMKPFLNFPEEHLTFYQQAKEINPGSSQHFQKDWLKGWTKGNTKTELLPESSEINWGKWNSEIPENKPLMQEYTAIEETSKANGTWMKNPDGTPFNGTPEQFVQQQSQNFKNAFPDYYGETLTTRSNNQFDTFDESKFGATDEGWYGKGIYTYPTEQAKQKGLGTMYGSNEYDLYVNSANKGFVEEPLVEAAEMYQKNTDQLFNELKAHNEDYIKKYGSNDLTERLVKESYDDLLQRIKAAEENNINQYTTLTVPSSANETIIPFSNRVKSAKNNNGMFDMTNPNIYKALIPAIGVGAASQIPQNKYGGSSGYKIGDEIDEDTMRKLKKLGYKFKKA